MSLREALARSSLQAEDLINMNLEARLRDVIHAYNDTNINPQFRTDVLGMLIAAVEFAEVVRAPQYLIDEVLASSTALASRVAQIQSHATLNRPRIVAIGLQLKSTGKVLPNMFATEEEATSYIKHLESIGITPGSFEMIPIEVSSAHVHRPSIAAATPAHQINGPDAP